MFFSMIVGQRQQSNRRTRCGAMRRSEAPEVLLALLHDSVLHHEWGPLSHESGGGVRTELIGGMEGTPIQAITSAEADRAGQGARAERQPAGICPSVWCGGPSVA